MILATITITVEQSSTGRKYIVINDGNGTSRCDVTDLTRDEAYREIKEELSDCINDLWPDIFNRDKNLHNGVIDKD